MDHVCSICAICNQRPATQMALPCRHFAYCEICVKDIKICTAKTGAKICGEAIVYKQKIFQVHPNNECPCSRCTICMENDAIYAKIPSGSLELCGDCVETFMQADLPYSSVNLAHGDTALLAKIIRSSDNSQEKTKKFASYIKVEKLPNAMCRLFVVDEKDCLLAVYSAIGPTLFLRYLDDNKYTTEWKNIDVNSPLDIDGNSLLHLAAASGLTDIVLQILKKNPFTVADQPNQYGATPLFVAAAKGHTKTVAAILDTTMPYLIHNMATKLDVVETAIYFSEKKALSVQKLWPRFFDEYRPQLDPNRFIHNNNGSTLYPLGSTAYSIAMTNRFFTIANLLRDYPGVDREIHLKPLKKLISHAESTSAHYDHDVMRYTRTEFTGNDELFIDQFDDDNNKDTLTTIVTVLPTKQNKFTAYYADKFVTSVSSDLFPLTCVIIYTKNGPYLRYMGGVKLDPLTDVEIPDGTGLMLLSNKTVQMGQFVMAQFVKQDKPVEKDALSHFTDGVMQLKNLAARFTMPIRNNFF